MPLKAKSAMDRLLDWAASERVQPSLIRLSEEMWRDYAAQYGGTRVTYQGVEVVAAAAGGAAGLFYRRAGRATLGWMPL